MKLRDFTSCARTLETYGGAAGRKLGIRWRNANYMLKFPDKLSLKKLKNVNLSYSNGPIAEFLGSQVFRLLGFPAHEVELGYFEGKLVCACKHIQRKNETLREFKDLRMTYIEDLDEPEGGASNDGLNTDIDSVLSVIRRHPILRLAGKAEEHFWNMFVVDALIGNADRNNGNWGVLVDSGQAVRIAPVYDNGAAFNSKWDDAKFAYSLAHDLQAMACGGVVCVFTRQGKKINPFHLMAAGIYPGLAEAARRIFPLIDLGRINAVIAELHAAGLVSGPQCEFYMRALELRAARLQAINDEPGQGG